MNNLQLIFQLLDDTRLSLYKNLRAYDDELPETYNEFIENAEKLKEQLDNILNNDDELLDHIAKSIT